MKLRSIEMRSGDEAYGRELCEYLERGDILLLSPTPYLPSEDDCAFLRSQKQIAGSKHKNIAYKPNIGKTTGLEERTPADSARLHAIMAAYSGGALKTLATLLPQYGDKWKVDYASFRPMEEQGRDLPLNARNDLMHVDAFPSRPTHGGRILRAFTNIHPEKPRVWGTSDEFPILAARYAKEAGLEKAGGSKGILGALGKLVGQPERSAYDEFMLGFHAYLKANDDFQKNGVRDESPFPPGSTWICFTDGIAHRATSGQFAMEQTCLVPFDALLLPEDAPISVLEKLAGRTLAVR